MEHADPGHRRSDALIGGCLRPPPCFDDVAPDALAFEQHPTQHLLGWSVALRCRSPIELGSADIVLHHTLALEVQRREVALADAIAAVSRKREPAERQRRVGVDAESLGEASADIALCPGDTSMGEWTPDRESGAV